MISRKGISYMLFDDEAGRFAFWERYEGVPFAPLVSLSLPSRSSTLTLPDREPNLTLEEL